VYPCDSQHGKNYEGLEEEPIYASKWYGTSLHYWSKIIINIDMQEDKFAATPGRGAENYGQALLLSSNHRKRDLAPAIKMNPQQAKSLPSASIAMGRNENTPTHS